MKSKILVPLCLVAAPFLLDQMVHASDQSFEEEEVELTNGQKLWLGYESFLHVYDKSDVTKEERELAVSGFVKVLAGLLDGARNDADRIINALVNGGESENLACELVGRAIKSLDEESVQREEQENQTKFQNTISTIVYAQNQGLYDGLVNNRLDPLQKKLDEQASLIGDLSKQNTAISQKVEHFTEMLLDADHATKHGEAFIETVGDFKRYVALNRFITVTEETIDSMLEERQEGFLTASSAEWGGQKNGVKLNDAVHKLLNATYTVGQNKKEYYYVIAPEKANESEFSAAISNLFDYAGDPTTSMETATVAKACNTISTWLMNEDDTDLSQIQPLLSTKLVDLRISDDLNLVDSVLEIIKPLAKDLAELSKALTPENEQATVTRPTAKLYRTVYELDTLLQLAKELEVIEKDPSISEKPNKEEEENHEPVLTKPDPNVAGNLSDVLGSSDENKDDI